MNLMRPRHRICLAPLAAIFAIVTHSHAADDEPMHATLRALAATYETAVSTGDLKPLEALFAPETSAVMTLGQEIRTFEELQQHWTHVRGLMGAGGSYQTKLNPERSLLFGDVALARGISDDVVKTGDGKEFQFQSKWTAVCRLVDGQWKVLRLHASMDPVGNVFDQAFMQRAKLTFGLGGIALGLVVGGFVGLRLGRKRTPA